MLFVLQIATCQHRWSQWCFGYKAAMDLNLNPPVTYSSSIAAYGSCASISNQNGNLLFYTNGDSIWNYNHQLMANGAGIAGWNQNAMTALILPKPASNNLYYVFTLDGALGPNHYCYSIVDMNLASGSGSVTVKNVPLWQPSLNAAKLSATKHCNGVDYWIIAHEGATNIFHSYLLSAAGLNTVPVVSAQGYTLGGSSYMKISPNGKKIAFGNTPSSNRYFAIHDFDNSTGTVGSNSIILNVPQVPGGLEFSADGTKFYATNSTGGQTLIWQWDLCAGNPAAVAASVQTLTAPTGTIAGAYSTYGQFQLASDGKIYIARYGQKNVGVINNPNVYGIGCNFVNLGPYLTSGFNGYSLPNNPTHEFRNTGSYFTSTVNCSDVQFNAPQHVQSSNGCAAIGPNILYTKWNFGDPLSASQNTSTALNPSHFYASAGTYSPYMVVAYPCYSDTFRNVVTITNAAPTISVTGKNSVCKNVTQTLSISGTATTYSWSGFTQTSTLVISPSVTTVYSITASNTLTGCTSKKNYTVTVLPCLGLTDQDGEASVVIFPNPNTGGVCNIQSGVKIIMVQVFDQQGRLVLEEKGKSIQNFETKKLPAGLYYVKLNSDNSVYRDKLLIE